MPIEIDIEILIKTANLGRSRRDAQEDTCAAFGAALYDLLQEIGVSCNLYVANEIQLFASSQWYHEVVEVKGTYYDSLGRFSQEIWKKRYRIHPKVSVEIAYKPDSRDGCYEDEFDAMYAFYLKALRNALKKMNSYTNAPITPKTNKTRARQTVVIDAAKHAAT